MPNYSLVFYSLTANTNFHSRDSAYFPQNSDHFRYQVPIAKVGTKKFISSVNLLVLTIQYDQLYDHAHSQNINSEFFQ